MNFKKVYSNKGECLSGLLKIYPKLFHDSRGFFQESWNKKNWDAALKSQNQLPKSFVLILPLYSATCSILSTSIM